MKFTTFIITLFVALLLAFAGSCALTLMNVNFAGHSVRTPVINVMSYVLFAGLVGIILFIIGLFWRVHKAQGLRLTTVSVIASLLAVPSFFIAGAGLFGLIFMILSGKTGGGLSIGNALLVFLSFGSLGAGLLYWGVWKRKGHEK